ncbi:MAG: MerR family transcriptional regulator [Deltaproteobacteria bacterium]|nr:MerR family transcriptional regulator [Deltaproteobacteria bacterium]
MNEKNNHIGEVAKKLGISARTVRYYEELGLISAERSSGGFRIYNPSQIEKLQTIFSLKEIGIPLDEIRHLLNLRHSGTNGAKSAPELIGYLKTKVSILNDKIAKYGKVAKELEEVCTLIENCKVCNHATAEATCEKCVDKKTDHNIPQLMKTLL